MPQSPLKNHLDQVAMRELAERNTEFTEKLTEVRAEPAGERAAGVALRQAAAELSLELMQAKEELAAASNVTRLPLRHAEELTGPG